MFYVFLVLLVHFWCTDDFFIQRNIPKEVHEQKLAEAQEIADAVLDAEVKIGELTSKMEKVTANQYVQSNTAVTKQNQLETIGINKMKASRFEQMAKHPQAVEKAKADARAEGRIDPEAQTRDRGESEREQFKRRSRLSDF